MTPRRMAIRAPNWLGDAVMAIPAMGAVRARYADASLTVVALPSVAPVFLEQTPASPEHPHTAVGDGLLPGWHTLALHPRLS